MKQPNALRLADALKNPMRWHELTDQEADDAAAELVRLHEANQELLQALKKAKAEFAGLPRSLGYEFDHIKAIDAAIAKAETNEGTA